MRQAVVSAPPFEIWYRAGFLAIALHDIDFVIFRGIAWMVLTKRRVVFVLSFCIHLLEQDWSEWLNPSSRSSVQICTFTFPRFLPQNTAYTRPRNGSLAERTVLNLCLLVSSIALPPEAFGFVWYLKIMSSISLNRSWLSVSFKNSMHTGHVLWFLTVLLRIHAQTFRFCAPCLPA